MRAVRLAFALSASLGVVNLAWSQEYHFETSSDADQAQMAEINRCIASHQESLAASRGCIQASAARKMAKYHGDNQQCLSLHLGQTAYEHCMISKGYILKPGPGNPAIN
jgi:hypothetical protein